MLLRLFIGFSVRLSLALIVLSKTSGHSVKAIKGVNTCPKWCSCDQSVANCTGNSGLTFIPKIPDDIMSLRVTKNHLENVTRVTFSNITHLKLQKLILDENDIHHISADAFRDLVHLQFLKISSSEGLNKAELGLALGSIQNHLELCIQLYSLNISQLDHRLVKGLEKSKIVELSLKGNRMDTFNATALKNLVMLHSLTLDRNHIVKTTKSGHKTIEELSLSGNNFIPFAPAFCVSRQGRSVPLFPSLISLDLSHCRISVIKSKTFACLRKLKKLILGENLFVEIRNDMFSGLSSLEVLSVSRMQSHLEVIENQAFNISTLKELDLYGNRIYMMSAWSTMFRFCRNLEKLNIGDNVSKMTLFLFVRMLSPLTKLRTLVLVHLKLNKIPYGLLNHFPNLTYLHLSQNSISKWDPRVFANVTNLKTLDLTSNKIRRIRQGTFPENIMATLQTLKLAHNDLECSCDMLWFRNWIENNKGKIILTGYPKFYICKYPATMDGVLFQDYHPTKESCTSKDILAIACAIFGTVMIVSVVTVLLVYRSRWYIRYWIYKRRKLVGERTPLLNESSTFDAYVIYNDEDAGFIRHELQEMVENEIGSRLLIRHRDSGLGGAKVDHIAEDIYRCGCVIAVLSNNFLKDPWCKFQVDVALDRQIEIGRNTLFIVKLEEVEFQSLTKAWCVLFTRTPSAEWSNDELRRKVIVQQLTQHLRDS